MTNGCYDHREQSPWARHPGIRRPCAGVARLLAASTRK